MNLYLDGSMLVTLASSGDQKEELCKKIEETLLNGDEILTSVLAIEECVEHFFAKGVDPYEFLHSIKQLVGGVLSLDDKILELALSQKRNRNQEYRKILHETIAGENHCMYLP